MPARACVRVFLILSILLLIATPSFARSEAPAPAMVLEPPAPPAAPAFSARADTFFLFAASGPGSYGSPGTDARGFTFDHEGGPAEAGWFGVDLTAQEGEWWHLAETALCAGTGTDMSEALPFDTGDTVNDYALWCGRSNVCGWVDPDGYGNHWSQYAVLDLSAHLAANEVVVDFAYRSDFEGDSWDWFEVRVDSAGTWKTVHHDNASNEQTYRELSFTIPAAEFGGGATRVGFYFQSDGAWSDEDGSWTSDLGAVWIDNIVATVDGAQVFAADFEDGLEPAEIGFETPPGAGLHAELRRGVFQEDVCIYNASYFWTFFDPGTTEPGEPNPVIPYGPPYVHEVIQSPILRVDQHGEAIEIGADTEVWIDDLIYMDSDLNALVIQTPPEIAVWSNDTQCLGPWVGHSTIWWESWGWHATSQNMTYDLNEAAGGNSVDGLAFRLGVRDMCGIWCNIDGDGSGHTSAPFYDNIRIKLINRSDADWSVSYFHRFQDNFPEPSGRVRIDSALEIQPLGSNTLVIGDSTCVDLNMDLLGGIKSDLFSVPGEQRPSLYMHFRVTAGPHAGSVDPAMGDPDASDGIWSPHIGTVDVNGDTWNVAIADTARDQGVPEADQWSFDLADDYFEAGDIIEFYYRAEALDGTVSMRPAWAESSDPDLRRYYRVGCLPSAGVTMLFVDDAPALMRPGQENPDGESTTWEEAFRYNGFNNYDLYITQAPTSGLQNGLGCRAELGQLSGYDMVIWDSGNIPNSTLTNALPYDLCFDTTMLSDWLNSTDHATGLWVMGNEVATDQMDAPDFLNTVLGVQRIHPYHHYYDDVTSVLIPRVLATHPDLAWLDGTPSVLLDGGCPSIENIDLVAPLGPFTEVTHIWKIDPGYGAVAGILNRDPDGDGTPLSPLGHENPTLFNPFSYTMVLDEGYGLPAGVDYARRMVGHILNAFFNQPLNDVVGVNPPPAATVLHGAYPNPFNPSTTIRFSLAEAGQVELRIYDLSGRRVRTLVNGRIDAGAHELEWQGRGDGGQSLASGVYFLQFQAGETTGTGKLILLK